MRSHLNHLLYVGQVRDLNSRFQKLIREGGKDVTEIAKQAVELASQFLIENSEEYLEAFSNQSTVFFNQRDFEASRLLLIRMIDRVDIDLLTEQEKHVYSSILNNLGVCYFNLNDFVQAAKYMVRSYGLKKNSDTVIMI